MLRTNLATAAATLVLSAFGLGLVSPTAEALSPIGSAPLVSTAAPSTVPIAYVKKKIVVKKKGTKKTTIVYRHRPGVHTYGVIAYHPRYYGCRTVIKYVKERNHRMVKVVRRAC